MTFRKALVLLAAATVLVIPNIAQAGGRGHGHGKGWGFGGFPAFAMKHHGHGKATSRAARDRSTRGVAHAMGVVRTTPASKHSRALDALQAALDREHGNATSRAARDHSTRGVAHAMDVVGTTPASKHSRALDALQTALDRTTLRGAKDSLD